MSNRLSRALACLLTALLAFPGVLPIAAQEKSAPLKQEEIEQLVAPIGSNTAQTAASMTRFNPDKSWKEAAKIR